MAKKPAGLPEVDLDVVDDRIAKYEAADCYEPSRSGNPLRQYRANGS